VAGVLVMALMLFVFLMISMSSMLVIRRWSADWRMRHACM
jgi:hypothetical protein